MVSLLESKLNTTSRGGGINVQKQFTFTNRTKRRTPRRKPIIPLRDSTSRDFFFQDGHKPDLFYSGAQWKMYPVTIEDFERSYAAGSETNCGFRDIFLRLEQGERLRLAVLGSSLSVANLCNSPTWGREEKCSWVNRVATWLKFRFPQWHLEVINLSGSGYSAMNFNDMQDPDVADFYLLEIGVNVAPEWSVLELMRKLKGPKLVVALFSTCGALPRYCERHHCTEKDKVAIPPDPERPRIGRLPEHENGNDTYFVCDHMWNRLDEGLGFLHANYSFANFRDLVWPDKRHPRRDLPHIWNGPVHPDFVAHSFIAHMVEYALLREFYHNQASAPCTIAPNLRSQCYSPLTVFDASLHPRNNGALSGNG
jgi:hypothetical protein